MVVKCRRTAISIERQFRTVDKAVLGVLQRTEAVQRIAEKKNKQHSKHLVVMISWWIFILSWVHPRYNESLRFEFYASLHSDNVIKIFILEMLKWTDRARKIYYPRLQNWFKVSLQFFFSASCSLNIYRCFQGKVLGRGMSYLSNWWYPGNAKKLFSYSSFHK